MSNIIERLSLVMAEVGAVKKDQVNEQQKYKFRGIDQIYNALHPLLAKNQIAVSCRVISHKTQEVVSKYGTSGYYVEVLCDYIFTAPDGSQHVTQILASSADYSDKAAMQAMSQAQKYALLQVFLIPTEDMKDADSKTHEAVPVHKPTALELRVAEGIQAMRETTSTEDAQAVWNAYPDLHKIKGFVQATKEHKAFLAEVNAAEQPTT